MPTLTDYDQFAGTHWETGTVRNFLAYRGARAPHTGVRVVAEGCRQPVLWCARLTVGRGGRVRGKVCVVVVGCPAGSRAR